MALYVCVFKYIGRLGLVVTILYIEVLAKKLLLHTKRQKGHMMTLH